MSAECADLTAVDGGRCAQQGLGGARRDPDADSIVGRPGEPGALTLSGAYESYLTMAGPTWRNEIDSSVGVELGRMSVKAAARQIS